MLESIAAGVGAMQGDALKTQVSVAVLRKALDAQKDQGEALTSMMKATAVKGPAASHDPGLGSFVDVYA